MEPIDEDETVKKEEVDLESKLIRSVLTLDEIDINLFRGETLWQPRGGRAVFGGQVVGQGLVAASHTKPDTVHVHSLHCYFVRPGKADCPIVYHVDNLRDGTSFSTRMVKAVQRGQVILSMMVSFHVNEESPAQHQFTMPDVPAPESLLSFTQLVNEYIKQPTISNTEREKLQAFVSTQADEMPIELKPVDVGQFAGARSFVKMDPMAPKQLLWIRARGHIGDHKHNLHRCAAAYISDGALLSTTLLPVPDMHTEMMASLDHSMWFHTHFRADEWMLYECESPQMKGNRALVLGRLWKRDGTLAVSVAQEGVVRGKLPSQL